MIKCTNGGQRHGHETVAEARECWTGVAKWAPEKLATPATEGMYRKDGHIYKVQRAVHGSDHLYAKRLALAIIDGAPRGKWEMANGMVAKLTQADRMPLDEAKAYGQLYGICVRCGAILTDEASRDAGIGPVCATKI